MPELVVYPGVFDSLGPIRDYIQRAAADIGLDKRITYRLTLAVDEIASNSIMHGYMEANRQGDLSLEAKTGKDRLVVVLEDNADPFDPTSIPSPDSLDLPPEERPIGGLGVYLALKGVDEYRYERTGNRNRHIFTVHLLKE